MNTPNEMRKFLGYMRKPDSFLKPIEESKPKKNMSMREMLGKMRRINEAIDTTAIDQKEQEEKMFNYFDDDNLVINFQPLKVYDNGVWWGGTMNEVINWVYKVSDDADLNTIDINNITIDKMDNFNLDDEKIRQIVDRLQGNDFAPERAEEIIRKLFTYYKEFSDYWIENKLQR